MTTDRLPPDAISFVTAADSCHISRQCVWRAAKRGTLQSAQWGKIPYTTRTWLAAWRAIVATGEAQRQRAGRPRKNSVKIG